MTGPGLLNTFLVILVVVGVLFITHHYWSQLNRAKVQLDAVTYWYWLIQGVLVPFIFWGIVNTGWWGLSSFVPEIVSGAAGAWHAWNRFMMHSLIVLVTFWGGITFLWILVWNIRAAEDHKEALITGGLLFLLGSPLAFFFLYLGGWFFAGMAVMGAALPAVHYSGRFVRDYQPTPSYSKAIARMKMGDFADAEWEVIRELENFEGDFEGWLMLADLYATKFGDLGSAEQTIVELCEQPEINISQRAQALHKLADWYLEVGHDPEGARLALEAICAKAPESHLDHMARLRINRLPSNREECLAQKETPTFALPHSSEEEPDPALDLDNSLPKENAKTEESQCLEALNRNPDDIEAREQLARLWALHLGRPAEGVEQVQLLLAMPDYPDEDKAKLLGRTIRWLDFAQADSRLGHGLRKQLVQEFPQSNEAFRAQKWLNLNS